MAPGKGAEGPHGPENTAPLTFGSGQAFGKERDDISSRLLSAANIDPTGIMCGNTTMNLSLDARTVGSEESFEKFVQLIEAYFQAGGLHVQMNHVSREELIAAKAKPDHYRSLRVRVSGFSTIFAGPLVCANNSSAGTQPSVAADPPQPAMHATSPTRAPSVAKRPHCHAIAAADSASRTQAAEPASRKQANSATQTELRTTCEGFRGNRAHRFVP